MLHLGNHPHIDDPVLLHLRLNDFDNSVVINGMYTFKQIISFLKRTGYLTEDVCSMQIRALNAYPYYISFGSELMYLPLTEFEKKLSDDVLRIDIC